MLKKLYRLKFSSGIHLSKGKEGNYDQTQVRLYSDTLKSALFVSALQLFGEDEIGLDFLESIHLSSGFPYCEIDGEFLYFLPKPKSLLEGFKLPKGMHERREKKFLRKVEYIEWNLLYRLLVLQEKDIQLSYKSLNKNKKFICDGHDLSEESIFSTSLQQHVSIPRVIDSNLRKQLSKEDLENWPTDSTPFTIDKIYFNANAGLYFIAEFKDDETKHKLEAALHLLSDSGLGTDKNSGGGTFSVTAVDDWKWEAPESANAQINLSLYCPERIEVENLDDDLTSYGLTKRGGYIANPSNSAHMTIRKKSIYMFEEGSIFPIAPNRKGRIVDLLPAVKPLTDRGIPLVNHPIYRDGRAIFLPITIKSKEQ